MTLEIEKKVEKWRMQGEIVEWNRKNGKFRKVFENLKIQIFELKVRKVLRFRDFHLKIRITRLKI